MVYGIASSRIKTTFYTMCLQEELKCTQQECAVLQDQLQLQRETAALSLDRVEQAGYRKQKKLAHLIKDLRKELREVEFLHC